MTVNPLLQHDMVIWNGKDPRVGYCFYTYNKMREVNGQKSICFPAMVDTMEQLGFEILPHWTNHGNVVGWYSIVGLKYHGPFKDVDDIEVNPVIQKILAGAVKNSSFKELLSLDKE